MGSRFARIAIVATVLTGTAVAMAGVTTTTASAATSNTTREVCAQSLYVRAAPAGVVIGTLFKGDNFNQERSDASGIWVFGHAYGNVHQDGWVENGWFC
jgi:hypothetical protein